jgi:hypothetical protein
MKSLIGNAILVGLAVATASVVGCSAGSSSSTGTNNTGTSSTPGAVSGEDTGSVGAHLFLNDGTEIDSVNYVLTCGATTVQSGTVATNKSNSIDFQLGSIPAQNGCTLTLTASSADADINCAGSATVNVPAHATVNTTVSLICTSAASNFGNVFVTGVPSYCGTWQSLSTVGPGIDAGPTNGSEVYADGSSPIVISVTASGASPASLVYNWTATTVSGNGVSIVSNTGNGTTSDTLQVVCNPDGTDVVGSSTLTLVVTDSADGGVVTCPSSLSTITTTVYCDKALSCPGTPTSTQCGPTTTLNCQNLTLNGNCGACGVTCAAGQVCSSPNPATTVGSCVCAPGTTTCGTACVNEQTDNNNCGACGNVCTGGATCQAGSCKVSNQTACNNYLVANAALGPFSNVCSATELTLWEKSPACLGCSISKGCVDGAGFPGFECNDATYATGITGGAGSTAETECVATLSCDIGVSPVASPGPAKGIVTVAFCGVGVSNSVCNTNPTGACVTQWIAGFNGTSDSAIQSNPGNNTLPSGVANTIVGCLNQNCSSFCF